MFEIKLKIDSFGVTNLLKNIPQHKFLNSYGIVCKIHALAWARAT